MKSKWAYFLTILMMVLSFYILFLLPSIHDNITFLLNSSFINFIIGLSWVIGSGILLTTDLSILFLYAKKRRKNLLLFGLFFFYIGTSLIPYHDSFLTKNLHVDAIILVVILYLILYIKSIIFIASSHLLFMKLLYPSFFILISITFATIFLFGNISILTEISLFFLLHAHSIYTINQIDKHKIT